MYMRKLNFYLSASAENKTTFSLYKRKIPKPPPYQNGCLLAFFGVFYLSKPPSLINFSQKILACLYQKQGGFLHRGVYT